MTVHVACASCGETFSARRHAGLVRCGGCEERSALRLPGNGAGTVVVLDTPGEAWV
jgi:hypothetical protein